MTEAGLNLLKASESLRLKVYRDLAGYPTIGWGHRVPDMSHPDITVEQAETFLRQDVGYAEKEALLQSPGLRSSLNRLAAITDFIFNMGSVAYRGSILKALVNNQEWHGASQEILKWNHAHVNGKLVVEPGLTKRRVIESAWLDQG
jgi:lysozyme